MSDQSEKLSADCHAAICDLQNLRQHLVDLRAKQWPAKDWDVSGEYVSANIGHAAKVAEWDLPKVDAAIRALSECWEMLESDAPAEDVRAVMDEPAAYVLPAQLDALKYVGWVHAFRDKGRTGTEISLYCHPQRPMVFPERREPSPSNPYLSDADIEWNACLDRIAELNK